MLLVCEMWNAGLVHEAGGLMTLALGWFWGLGLEGFNEGFRV